MDPFDQNGAEGNGSERQLHLPPPPDVVPPDVIPEKLIEPPVKKVVLVPAPRRNIGSKGSKIPLLTNHFNVNVRDVSGHFFQYSVSLFYEDGRPVEQKGVGRKVIDKMHTTYGSELGGKDLAYDGEKSLFTLGALPSNKLEFTVVIDEISSNRNTGNGSPKDSSNDGDRKRMRRPYQSKTFKVEISYATKIAMQAIAQALRGQENENTQEALRVLDIILRQHASKQGCLLVRQSFFHNDPRNFADVGGGVLGVRGFHSSFRTTQGGLSLNVDVSTTMIIQPGPVIDFLMANQNAKDPFSLDWTKAKRTLKNLRVTARPSNSEFKISGLSEKPCREQMFSLKQRGANEDDNTIEITVSDYFRNYRQIVLQYSDNLPCINVGRPKRPTYIPVELCSLVSLQRYTKSLNVLQRSSLVEKSRQKPPERMRALTDAIKASKYDSEPMLRSCGISIGTQFTSLDGRVLQPPRLKCGNGDDLCPRNGRWNFNNKKLLEPAKVERWAVVNFSARCVLPKLIQDLIKCGAMKGIAVESDPFVFEETPDVRRAPPIVRVDKMFVDMRAKLPGPPKFLLCLLPERKNSDLYGPWKRRCLTEFGVATQCLAPIKVNDQYLTNVLLKINAKLGGLNSLLGVESVQSIPLVSKVPTIIIGMDVSHGSPGHGDLPSIAAVVSSRQWPLISRYRASVRTQSPKVEMIDSLFKKVSDKEDEGVIREGLKEFYITSGKRKPDQIIIFRDGVSESQFHQVLNIELEQIMEACKFLDETWRPKFVLIVAQKNHHTKFFQNGSPENVPAGTVVDNKICHPRNYDFYMCAHAGMIGTTRPTHYHVLLDQVGFTPDELQDLVHSLSYVYQRSTTAISLVAPICYAHLAASQVGQFVKFEESSETSSSHGGMTSAGAVPVPQLPKLDEKVCHSMFFC